MLVGQRHGKTTARKERGARRRRQPTGDGVEVRHGGRLQRGAAPQRGDGDVAHAVDEHKGHALWLGRARSHRAGLGADTPSAVAVGINWPLLCPRSMPRNASVV